MCLLAALGLIRTQVDSDSSLVCECALCAWTLQWITPPSFCCALDWFGDVAHHHLGVLLGECFVWWNQFI